MRVGRINYNGSNPLISTHLTSHFEGLKKFDVRFGLIQKRPGEEVQ
jgi:hypothetical protein